MKEEVVVKGFIYYARPLCLCACVCARVRDTATCLLQTVFSSTSMNCLISFGLIT